MALGDSHTVTDSIYEYNHRDESGAYFSDPCEKYGAKLDTKTQVQPEVNQQKPTSQTVNTDPVNTDLEIQDLDFQEFPTQPPPPTTSVSPTTPSPRRSMRSNAGKTSKYDEYIKTVLNLANILCSELLHHSRYLTEKVPKGGGG